MSDLYDRTGATKAVLHHLGDKLGPAQSAEELKRRANPNGWQFPDYDYGILADGSVVELRPLTYIGAHTIADRSKYAYGKNWWNEHSIGVVMANDNQDFPPTPAMVTGTTKLLSTLVKTIDDIYPHFQVTQTDCPGAKYSKVGLDTGHLDYDEMESNINTILNKPVAVLPPVPKKDPMDYTLKEIIQILGG